MSALRFELLHRDPISRARLGRLVTPRGVVRTPAFMPVGTQATVKSLDAQEVRETGAEIVLANTFHLYLRPGPAVVARAGGLHRFMAWDGPILTDSGGFQIFSLGALARLTPEGVTFRSPLDGSEHTFTPERVLQIQRALGSDLVMPLDVCLGYPTELARAREALRTTLAWAARSKAYGVGPDQVLFGIVQGGFDETLRREAVERTVALDFEGYAIGGLSVGEPRELGLALLAAVTEGLPEDRPRYVMGVGSPVDLLEAIARGADMFDCVLPTRVARTGVIFTRTGRLTIRSGRFRDDHTPPDPACRCRVCVRYSRAYLRHLFHTDEMLGPRLATYHNLAFLGQLMEEARAAIAADRFAAWRRAVLEAYRTRW
jgi:queuine tRNA-ribosyltransferase